MRNLIQLLFRYHFFLLFLLLEVFSIYLVVRYNHFQRASFNSLTTSVEGFFYQQFSGLRDYMNLRQVHEELVRENIMLRNRIDRLLVGQSQAEDLPAGSAVSRKFLYTPASVIKNSTNKAFNYLTIDKGSLHNVRPEMAVIAPAGVAGMVFSVSRHFAIVMPVLNMNFRLSARLAGSNYFGSLSWPGKNATTALLTDIPSHVSIAPGDTVETSGFSAIFPPGLMVGTIKEFSSEEGNFYSITVDLSVDFRNLTHVYVIDNLFYEEQENLEKSTLDD